MAKPAHVFHSSSQSVRDDRVPCLRLCFPICELLMRRFRPSALMNKRSSFKSRVVNSPIGSVNSYFLSVLPFRMAS